MSDFGDWEPADSFDTDAPDPESVARLLLRGLRHVTKDESRPLFDDLHPDERAAYAYAFADLLDRLRREGGLR